jgi:hypothetical protein
MNTLTVFFIESGHAYSKLTAVITFEIARSVIWFCISFQISYARTRRFQKQLEQDKRCDRYFTKAVFEYF